MIKDWIKANTWSASFATGCVVLTVMCFVASGYLATDLISVDVPKDVLEATGHEGKVSLTEVPDVWDDWQAYVEKNTKRLESETDKSYELLGFINTATDVAISGASQAAPAFPGGALLIGALGGAAGLFMKKPGTDRAIAKEKEASYNAGISKAETLAKIAGVYEEGDCDDCEGECDYECEEEVNGSA